MYTINSKLSKKVKYRNLIDSLIEVLRISDREVFTLIGFVELVNEAREQSLSIRECLISLSVVVLKHKQLLHLGLFDHAQMSLVFILLLQCASFVYFIALVLCEFVR